MILSRGTDHKTLSSSVSLLHGYRKDTRISDSTPLSVNLQVASLLYLSSVNSVPAMLNFYWMTSCSCLLPAKMGGLKVACIGHGLDFRSQLVLSPVQDISNRPNLFLYWNRPLLPYQIKCQTTNDSMQNSISTESAWKEKLAAVDENAQKKRIQSQQIHEEYKRRLATMQRENMQVPANASSLKDLEFISYLNDEGLIVDKSEPNAKASVYAIFDENRTLQYVGISRQVFSSMKLHFARVPSKCHFFKVQHVNQPNRAQLEFIKEKWIEENGFLPSGNDNGPLQKIWENPLDCKPLMTENEKQNLEADPGTLQAKILKNVARRIESELDATYKKRNCKEKFWFDPKLKEKGLLDLRTQKRTQSVPASVPKPESAA